MKRFLHLDSLHMTRADSIKDFLWTLIYSGACLLQQAEMIYPATYVATVSWLNAA